MSDVNMLRLGILVAGLILIAAILFFGRPKRPGQGRRVAREGEGDAGTYDPMLDGGDSERSTMDDLGTQSSLFESERRPNDDLGKRTSEQFDKIVTLYLAARAGSTLSGPDIVVAAEKAGLVYGHMGVFHRLVEHHPERGPVFSVANIKKPGSFEMATIQSLETPAIAFFLTLPAPVSALDAWETMLPTVQRMSELLDAVVLDEQRNVLARQRIAEIREEVRAYDRQREAPPLTKPARW